MPFKPLVEDKIRELLQSDLKGFHCPVCGHHEFAIWDELGSSLRTNLMHYEGDNPTPKQRTRLITIACANCGHLEQFAEHPLRRRAEALLETADE